MPRLRLTVTAISARAPSLTNVEATMEISTCPVADRPRERLLSRGAAVLSDGELLALLLRTGVAGRSALELARDLLARFGGLVGLFAASVAEVSAMHGLGPAKAAVSDMDQTDTAKCLRPGHLAQPGVRASDKMGE